MKHEIEIPDHLALDTTEMVVQFAEKMAAKLAEKQARLGTSWTTLASWSLQQGLFYQIRKGDPVDVANFCAMLSARGLDAKPRVSVIVHGVDLLYAEKST